MTPPARAGASLLGRPAESLVSWDRRTTWLWALVGLGLVLRSLQYLADPSLWIDEAMLALNIAGRTLGELRAPLDHEQVAPLLFLHLERHALEFLGRDEMALRLVPFVAGCAVMPLALLCVRRALPAGARGLALFLLAVSDPLIDYSAQVKPYACDAAVSLLILWNVLRLWEGRARPLDLLLLAALAFLGPWISFGSVFVMAAAFAVLAPRVLSRRDPALSLGAGGAFLVWIASGVGLLLFFSGWGSVGSLRGVWERSAGFAPLPPRSGEDLLWYAGAAYRMMRVPGGILLAPAGLVLAGLGALHLGRERRPSLLVLLAAPLLLAWGASALELYPFSGRLLLFAAPALAFFVILGLWCLARWAGPGGGGDGVRAVRLAALGLLAAATLGVEAGRAAYHAIRPRVREEVREMARLLDERARPDDIVYVYYGAAPTFAFYASDPPYGVVHGAKSRGDPEAYRRDLDALRGHERVWVLLSHVYDWGEVDEGRLILEHLESRGRRLESHPRRDGGLHLYDLSRMDRAP